MLDTEEIRVRELEVERNAWKSLSEHLDRLLVCYRVGKQPSDKLLDGIKAIRDKLSKGQ